MTSIISSNSIILISFHLTNNNSNVIIIPVKYNLFPITVVTLLCCFLFACVSKTAPEIEEIPVEVKEPEPVISEEKLEYERSVSALSETESVTEETFTSDKSEILQIIAELDNIMKTKDYKKWLEYITPESIEYWSNARNLSDLSIRLYSNYNFKLVNLQEYFEKFFIPARKGRQVDEIRYVTTTVIKAVQYKDDQDIIYYYFEKRGDKWLLYLDTLSL